MNLGTLLKQNHISTKIDIPMKSKRFIDTYEMMSLNHQVSSLDELIRDCENEIVYDNGSHWTATKYVPVFSKFQSYDDFIKTYGPSIQFLNSKFKGKYDDTKLSSIWADIVRIQNQVKANNIANN